MDLGSAKVALDTLWVMLTAFLVFWMNAGFALLEAGLCQAKNAVNILAKNFIVFGSSNAAALLEMDFAPQKALCLSAPVGPIRRSF